MIKAAILEAPHTPLVVRELSAPALEPGAAWLETLYSEVCGTDVHLYHGKLAGVPYPIIPGHINVGRVVEMNGIVRDFDGNVLKAGVYCNVFRCTRDLPQLLVLPGGQSHYPLPAT